MSVFAGLLVLLGWSVQAGADPVAGLTEWLKQPVEQRGKLEEQAFASVSLTKEQAAKARQLLAEDEVQEVRKSRVEEWNNRAITLGTLTMKFDVKVFGDKPAGGRSLFISMHGGGNSGSKVNDQQWDNQKRLYKPAEGVYIAPRAPNDAWDMWFQPHMDAFFAQLIQDAATFEDVDINRVYLMGYSAGGDGVFRMAPRMADRWAAAAMMAGHPGDVRAENLRNLPFTLHMGENDKAYDRNKHAVEWKKILADLHEADKDGYVHEVVIRPGMSHWMQGKDAVAVPWMAMFTRNTAPKKVVWYQPFHQKQQQFYWLADAVAQDQKLARQVVATIEKQTIQITSENVGQVTVRLRDDLMDLDQPVVVKLNGKVVFEGKVARNIKMIGKTLGERHDVGLSYDAEIVVK
ncbi:MAG TPA: dienelactone hydrolase family protein [Gemmatales bacterium]|nr:dienelactone hydrolase family protein [Gemmatales bacterium]